MNRHSSVQFSKCRGEYSIDESRLGSTETVVITQNPVAMHYNTDRACALMWIRCGTSQPGLKTSDLAAEAARRAARHEKQHRYRKHESEVRSHAIVKVWVAANTELQAANAELEKIRRSKENLKSQLRSITTKGEQIGMPAVSNVAKDHLTRPVGQPARELSKPVVPTLDLEDYPMLARTPSPERDIDTMLSSS